VRVFFVIISLVLIGGEAHARNCSPAEFQEDRIWSNPSCTAIVDRPGARARPPSKREVGALEWVDRFTDALRLVAASINTNDTDEWRRQRGELTKLMGDLSKWPNGAWLPAKATCSDAVGGTLAWMDDVVKGSARASLAAEMAIERAKTSSQRCIVRLTALP
jgi:hypothetical protein